MGFVIAAIVTTIVIGLPVTLAIDRHQRGAGLVGLSYLYGAGSVWALLLLMSLVRMPWTVLSTTIVLVVFAALVWAFVLFRTPELPRQSARNWSSLALVVDLATAFSLAAYAMYATVARVWSWDFWAIWGLKARVFVENRGIDWSFLQSPFNDFAHPDYPLLVPMNYAYTALVSGGWDDRWMGLGWIGFTVALVLIVRSMASREVPELPAALIGFATAGAAFTRYVGLADAALVACAAAAIVMIRRYLLFEDEAAFRHGAILLGLAASTKNEGVALIATIVIAVLVHEYAGAPRSASVSPPVASRLPAVLARLWPAIAIALPWIVIRTAAHLQTDIARGSFISRAIERAGAMVPIVATLLRQMPDPWIWLFMLVGVVLMTREARAAERFTFAAVVIQLFWYVATYFGTPLDVAFHIETSWPRVARHVEIPFLFVVMIALAQAALRRETLAHAEARPDLH